MGDMVVTLNGKVRRITGRRGRLAVLDGSITYDLADLRMEE